MFDLPEIEIDELTGKPKYVQLQQNSLVYSPINRKILYTKAEVDAKIQSVSGGGVQAIIAGTNISVDSTDPTRPIVSASTSASGITRSIVVTSGNINAGSSPSTDYVYIISGPHTVTLPSAVSNTNRYTLKNSHTANVSLAFTGGQTADGGGVTLAPQESVELLSNGSNWIIV